MNTPLYVLTVTTEPIVTFSASETHSTTTPIYATITNERKFVDTTLVETSLFGTTPVETTWVETTPVGTPFVETTFVEKISNSARKNKLQPTPFSLDEATVEETTSSIGRLTRPTAPNIKSLFLFFNGYLLRPIIAESLVGKGANINLNCVSSTRPLGIFFSGADLSRSCHVWRLPDSFTNYLKFYLSEVSKSCSLAQRLRETRWFPSMSACTKTFLNSGHLIEKPVVAGQSPETNKPDPAEFKTYGLLM